ncbi:MAG: class I SAM-dependent methyltransferase [Candidatus Pacebacteria bacterium]|nr:class I SAM-dependent methyltransferase [Candidatus Paceibacterota bacterium]
MIFSSTNRKLANTIRGCAELSIDQCQNKQEWISGINYLTDHFLFDLSIYRNIRIVDYLVKKIPQNAKVLDWGCGYGDVSYLLKNKRPDLEIILYDVLSSPPWEVLTKHANLKKIICRDQRKIPFQDNFFDAIVGVGVLEHVEDQKYSLKEVYRILKPKAQFFVFLYPNSFSYTEKFQKLIKHPFHENPLSIKELSKSLTDAKFLAQDQRYQFMLPFILSRFPICARRSYNIFGNLIALINIIFEKIPLLNKLSSNIMIVVRKR